jgi:hypothetical protein
VFAHRRPVVKLFGSLGLTPKYRFGLYGPHNKDAFEAASEALEESVHRKNRVQTASRKLHRHVKPLEEGAISSKDGFVKLVNLGEVRGISCLLIVGLFDTCGLVRNDTSLQSDFSTAKESGVFYGGVCDCSSLAIEKEAAS